jgi:GrpB protein
MPLSTPKVRSKVSASQIRRYREGPEATLILVGAVRGSRRGWLATGRITSSTGSDAVRIEHIGSTAVPGLAAQRIIDLLVTVEDPEDGGGRERLSGSSRLSQPRRH